MCESATTQQQRFAWRLQIRIMGLPGLSRPAGDAAKQAERRRRPDVQKLQPIHWAVLAVAGGVLFSVGKLLKHIVRSDSRINPCNFAAWHSWLDAAPPPGTQPGAAPACVAGPTRASACGTS